MGQDELKILEALDRLLKRPGVARKIDARAARAERQLVADPSARLTWARLPLGWFGRRLPGGIRSAWVFVLRARTNTGAERHPNSHQRTMSWRGAADFQTFGKARWHSHRLRSSRRAAPRTRSISIPQGVWHRPIVGRRNWVVVSFHTAGAKQLIEERPNPKAPGSARRSFGQGGPAHRSLGPGGGIRQRIYSREGASNRDMISGSRHSLRRAKR